MGDLYFVCLSLGASVVRGVLLFAWAAFTLRKSWRCASVLLVVSGCFALGRESVIDRVVAKADLTELSAPYRVALQMAHGFPADVHLSFLGEDRLAISSMDGSYSPAFGHTPKTAFRFTVDILHLASDGLRKETQLRFDTETSFAQFAALPSGRFIVGTVQKISIIDLSGRVVATVPSAKVCGSSVDIDLTEPYNGQIRASSEQIGFAAFQRAGRSFPLDGPPIPVAEGWGCWFSTVDLQPIRQTRSQAVLGVATLHGFTAYNNRFWSLSSDEEHALAIPSYANCNVDDLELQYPHFYLLRAEPASGFLCRKGAVTIQRGSRISTMRIDGGGDWLFRTDAWNVPLAVFVNSTVHLGLGHFSGGNFARLVNYQSGISCALPSIKIDVHANVYGGETLDYAISPSGRYVAVLSGSMLVVYKTPEKLLN